MEKGFIEIKTNKKDQEHINRVRAIREHIDETRDFQLKVIKDIYEQGRELEIFGCPAHIKMCGEEGIYFPAQNSLI